MCFGIGEALTALAVGTAASTTAAGVAIPATAGLFGVGGTVTLGGAVGGIATAAGLAGAAMQGIGQHQQANAMRDAAKYNQRMAEYKAVDAERRGSIAESQANQRTRAILGSVAAKQGSSGVVAGDGTGADVLTEVAEYGARDAATIHANAAREAWGIRSQSAVDSFQANNRAAATDSAAAGTFLQGVNTFASSPWWKKYETTSAPFAGQKADVSWSGY